jgi:hypothetical protein
MSVDIWYLFAAEGKTHRCFVNMSGIEVAALVLGGFPLLISGLEHYQKGLKPVRDIIRYKGELVALQAFVESEYAKFLNSLELLLQPVVVDTSELYRLLKDPRHAGWRAPHLKATLRRRLGHSEDEFYKAVSVIKDCVEELKAALKDKAGAFLSLVVYGVNRSKKLT